ncbi:MAG: YicC family protein [Nitrospiraceae bacterium]|nr:MAG: YicC family protein [Nitrospiraceae bacterium]
MKPEKMQAQSMTGYGRSAAENIKVEIRSINHKNLDIHVSLPSILFAYEGTVKKAVKNRFSRGRIEVNIVRPEADAVKVKINKSLAREYYNALNSLKDDLSLSDDIGIQVLAGYRDIFCMEEDVEVGELNNTLEAALDELQAMRIEEGRNLVRDIKERVGLIHEFGVHVEKKRDSFISETRQKLYERLQEFLADTAIDDDRLVQEAAILVERTDITEEIVRIKSHLEHLEKLIETPGEAIGKKIDFIVQELRREVNTIGSKARDAEISTQVVEMKYELEKIKEQAQNLQ